MALCKLDLPFAGRTATLVGWNATSTMVLVP
jgi:hypothetical protein